MRSTRDLPSRMNIYVLELDFINAQLVRCFAPCFSECISQLESAYHKALHK